MVKVPSNKVVPELNPYDAPLEICPTCRSVMWPEVGHNDQLGTDVITYRCQNPQTACNYRHERSLMHAMGTCFALKPEEKLAPGSVYDPLPAVLKPHFEAVYKMFVEYVDRGAQSLRHEFGHIHQQIVRHLKALDQAVKAAGGKAPVVVSGTVVPLADDSQGDSQATSGSEAQQTGDQQEVAAPASRE